MNAVELTRRLVSIPSVNPMGKDVSGPIYLEKKMADFIAEYLSALNVPFEVFGAHPLRPNLLATIDGGKQETIMLEAHMDTVSHEQMIIDPFDPVIKDGQLYGRGSCDTKASLATYLYAIGEIARNNLAITRNIVLACVNDEEYSFGGSRELVQKGVKASFAIVGEPTSLNIIYAQKGVSRFFIHTEGISCHSSMPWLGKNAIYKMKHVLAGIEAYAAELEKITHSVLGFATINVGIITGGQTVNTVPAKCTIEIDHRLLPGDTFESVKKRLTSHLSHADYFIDDPYLWAPGMQNQTGDEHCAELRRACEANGVITQFETAPYATDAAIIHHAGIPCIVFGPGDIKHAHTANEHIAVSDIEKAGSIILSLLTQ